MVERYSDAARIVGGRIREKRQLLALSQEDVAHLAEMHVTNFGKIERGRANPSLTTMVRIATALNMDPSELVQGLTGSSLPERRHNLTAADFIRERDRREQQQ